jgi:hypothetical protein
VPSGSRINLLWTDNANNEDGFTLERADAGVGGGGPCGTFVTIQPSLPANTTGFNDTGLGANHWYCYRVRAFNGEVILLGRTHCQLGVTLSNEQRRSCVNWSPVDTGYLSTCTPWLKALAKKGRTHRLCSLSLKPAGPSRTGTDAGQSVVSMRLCQ